MATLKPITTLIELCDPCKAGDAAYRRLCVGALAALGAQPWSRKLYPSYPRWYLCYQKFGEFLDTRRYTEQQLVQHINSQIGKCGAVEAEWSKEAKKPDPVDVERFLPADEEEEEAFPGDKPVKSGKRVKMPVKKVPLKVPTGQKTPVKKKAAYKPKQKPKRPKYDALD